MKWNGYEVVMWAEKCFGGEIGVRKLKEDG